MVIYFYGHRSQNKYGYLSNFYPSKFVINANIINRSEETTVYNAEQAIMWLKALLMNDIKMANIIVNEPKPALCKRYGRQVKPFNETKWLKYRDKIAFEILKVKFQDPKFKKLLIATGNEIIAEAAPNDKIWGIGISETEALKGMAWNGENVLGNTLMSVRKCISENI